MLYIQKELCTTWLYKYCLIQIPITLVITQYNMLNNFKTIYLQVNTINK